MRREIRVLVDDLSGEQTDDVTTVLFGLDGKSYEIDLSSEHAIEMGEILAPYVVAARKVRAKKLRR